MAGVNTLRPRQNGRHFADHIFKCIFLNKNVWFPIKISLKFVPKGQINKIPAMVQIMDWRRPGDKPLSEPMVVSLPTHICVIRPQWVKPLETMIICKSCVYLWWKKLYVPVISRYIIFLQSVCTAKGQPCGSRSPLVDKNAARTRTLDHKVVSCAADHRAQRRARWCNITHRYTQCCRDVVCLGLVISLTRGGVMWFIYPYYSLYTHWHGGNDTITPVPVK